MNDHIATAIKPRHIVAVSETVILETPDNDITSNVTRGIYAFTSFKAARHFKTTINNATENETASLYSRAYEENT